MWQSEKIWPACDFGWHSCWASCYIWKARLIISGHFLLPASPSSAAMPVQHDKSRMQHDLSSKPQQAFIHWHWPVNVPRSSTQLSGVYSATSSAIDAGGIHRGRRSLDPLKTTSNSPLRLSVALLSWCPKTYPVTWDVSHGVWQKYREFKGRIRSQTFAVKAEACFGYLNGQTSVQCELIVSHCQRFAIFLVFRFRKKFAASKKTCWKQSPLVVEENGERSPSDKVNDLNRTSLRSHTSIRRHPKLRTTPESVLVDCSKDCRLSLWSWYVFGFGIPLRFIDSMTLREFKLPFRKSWYKYAQMFALPPKDHVIIIILYRYPFVHCHFAVDICRLQQTTTTCQELFRDLTQLPLPQHPGFRGEMYDKWCGKTTSTTCWMARWLCTCDMVEATALLFCSCCTSSCSTTRSSRELNTCSCKEISSTFRSKGHK